MMAQSRHFLFGTSNDLIELAHEVSLGIFIFDLLAKFEEYR